MIDDRGNEPGRRHGDGHVESWFLKLNSPDGKRALWLKWTLLIERGTPARAESWAIVFRRGRPPVAFKRSWTLAPGMIRTPFALDFGGNTFDGLTARGQLDRGSSRLHWDASLDPQVPSLRPYPFEWMYRTRIPESKPISPIPDASAHGHFDLDGERVDFSGWRGMQGHNWGTRNAHRYVWLQANGFEGGDDVVLEAFSGRLRKGPVELPWLTMAFVWIDGGWIRFDEPALIASARSEVGVVFWRFETRRPGWRLRGEARASSDGVAGLHYVNPADGITHCLNSKLADLEILLEGDDGTHRVMRTDHAALEVGWPSADHGVRMLA